MSHFYGVLKGSRGAASRAGTKASGLTAVAASWAGCVKVYVYIDQQGRDCFVVYQDAWQGAGIKEDLARGVLGKPAGWKGGRVITPQDPTEPSDQQQCDDLVERGYHSNPR